MTPRVFTIDAIRAAFDPADALRAIEIGFARFARGEVVVPPVGELVFENPPGDVHIKYGYVRGDDVFVVKIASGFYDNAALGLATQNGLMLVFAQRTGALEAVLLDDGWLTDVRTAMAGAIAAKHLAPPRVTRIGVLGSGVQARLQVRYLADVVPCRRLKVWARNRAHAEAYARDMPGFEVGFARDGNDFLDCELIVTTTPATEPVLGRVARGTHVTAVGADSPHKRELAPDVTLAADRFMVDSLEQCETRGELRHVRDAIDRSRIVALGDVVRGAARGRDRGDDVTIADLTGVAVQDIQIATSVLARLRR